VPRSGERERLLQVQACVNLRLRRATRSLSSFYDRVLEPSGLHGNQLMLLIPPYLADGMTINRLAEVAGLDRTTLARNLRLLQQRQLLSLRRGQDQRTRVVHVTPRGERALQQALPLWEDAQRQVTEVLGPHKLSQLERALDTLEAALPAPTD
jgi:DNA-binding MarR family transcriptional regulator